MLDLTLKKSLDAICIGRAGMDLYANETNTNFAEVTQFNKHVGGSPANIAVGMAKLGAQVGFIGKVSDDVVGHYVKGYLEEQGINTAGVSIDDSGTRTSLALTEMRPDNCAVVIYRNNAADLALCTDDINADFVASARMLVVSGTALSANPSRQAAYKAIEIAHANNTKVVLDLDYRAYTWRSLQEASEVYQHAAEFSNMLIGNNEEFEVMGVQAGSEVGDTAKACLRGSTQAVLIKGGAQGSFVYTSSGDHFTQGSFAVDVVKPFGAGDAYAAGICAGVAAGLPLSEAVQRGSAAAAIVVAGYACSSASPNTAELTHFLQNNEAAKLAQQPIRR